MGRLTYLLRGFYTAASGMITQQRHQEALANNIANANTPGYKADEAVIRSFPELLMRQMGTSDVPATNGLNIPRNRQIGPLHTGVYVQEMIPDFSQGPLNETSLQTDLALVSGQLPDESGNLFFTVQNEVGDVRYTRNGNFTVDGQGMLVTTEGYYVLDVAGNPVATNGMDFNVTANGLLQVEGQVTELGISYVADATLLEKEGNGLFSGEGADVPAEATFTIEQGFLERSNVDSLRTMTAMTESYRMFETNQRVLRAYDESMGKAVNEIGRIG